MPKTYLVIGDRSTVHHVWEEYTAKKVDVTAIHADSVKSAELLFLKHYSSLTAIIFGTLDTHGLLLKDAPQFVEAKRKISVVTMVTTGSNSRQTKILLAAGCHLHSEHEFAPEEIDSLFPVEEALQGQT